MIGAPYFQALKGNIDKMTLSRKSTDTEMPLFLLWIHPSFSVDFFFFFFFLAFVHWCEKWNVTNQFLNLSLCYLAPYLSLKQFIFFWYWSCCLNINSDYRSCRWKYGSKTAALQTEVKSKLEQIKHFNPQQSSQKHF